MSFFRHREIFRSDVSRSAQEQRTRCSLVHRLNEFPAGYSSAGCSPTWPASASPAEFHSALQSFFRSSIIHRTANSALTGCLTSGGHPKFHSMENSTHVIVSMEVHEGNENGGGSATGGGLV